MVVGHHISIGEFRVLENPSQKSCHSIWQRSLSSSPLLLDGTRGSGFPTEAYPSSGAACIVVSRRVFRYIGQGGLEGAGVLGAFSLCLSSRFCWRFLSPFCGVLIVLCCVVFLVLVAWVLPCGPPRFAFVVVPPFFVLSVCGWFNAFAAFVVWCGAPCACGFPSVCPLSPLSVQAVFRTMQGWLRGVALGQVALPSGTIFPTQSQDDQRPRRNSFFHKCPKCVLPKFATLVRNPLAR